MTITDFHIYTIQLLTEQYLEGKMDLTDYIKEIEERMEYIKKRAGD